MSQEQNDKKNSLQVFTALCMCTMRACVRACVLVHLLLYSTWKSASVVSQGSLVAGEAVPSATHTSASPMVKCSSNCFACQQQSMISVTAGDDVTKAL